MDGKLEPLDGGRAARLWTAERLPLTLPLAGLGERGLAYFVDLVILVLLASTTLFVYSFFSGDIQADWTALGPGGQLFTVLAILAALAFYDIGAELLFDGQTPGKRVFRLRVITARGTRPELLDALVRNVVRVIDYLPFMYGVGVVTLFVTGTRRLGDLLADTVVVTERSRAIDPFASLRDIEPLTPAPRWSDEQLLQVLEFLDRIGALPDESARKLAKKVLAKIEPDTRHNDDDALAHLRRGAAALRDAATGLGAQIRRCIEAEHALHQALSRPPARVKKDKTKALRSAERLDAAARAATNELMRGTRRSVPRATLEALSLRLLDAERSKRRARRRGRMARFFARDVPGAVYRERKQVLRAAMVLATGTTLGFSLGYVDEVFGRFLLGPELSGMIERGASWTDQIEQSGAHAQAATMIILNNVRIAWIAFAAGLLGGALPLLILGMNGLHLGAVFGYAVRLGTHATLGKFILAHGPVEMSAICIAGAAGICVGRAIVAPGRRRRLDALRVEAATGVRLVLFATVALGTIGLVEGFVSPGQFFPLWANALVGATMFALFFSWVWFFGRPAERARVKSEPLKSG